MDLLDIAQSKDDEIRRCSIKGVNLQRANSLIGFEFRVLYNTKSIQDAQQ